MNARRKFAKENVDEDQDVWNVVIYIDDSQI